MNLVRMSINRPSVIVVTFIALTIMGLYSMFRLQKELMPPLTLDVITIRTSYPGAGPHEVETSVTEKIEDVVYTISGIDNLSSSSMEGLSIITINLKSGADLDKAIQEVQRKLNLVKADLPDDVEEPVVSDFSLSDLPIMTIGAVSDLNGSEFYDFIDKVVKPGIEQIPGVAQVDITGGNEREIQVNINPERLNAYRLSINDVCRIIKSSGLDYPTGKIENKTHQNHIRLLGKYNSIYDIENVVLKHLPDGTAIKVGDVADVKDGHKDSENISRVNGASSIGISVRRASEANTVAISSDVRAHIEELKSTYAKYGLEFTITSDNAEFTTLASDSVITDLMIAVILVAISMILFLCSFRNAIIVSVSIPLALISTFLTMYICGFSLNLMSLLALSLVVGILVDDAIVVVENIHRHMEMGKTRIQASYDGITEIGTTILSITIVLIAVFVPVSMAQGTIANVFRQFALTIAIAVAFSLLISFTIVPFLYSRFGRINEFNPQGTFGKAIHYFENKVSLLAQWFSRLLQWSLSHKLITLIATGFVLFGSLSLIIFGFIGSNLAPLGDQGLFVLKVELPRDVSLEKSNEISRVVEGVLKNSPVVESVFTIVGAEENGKSQTRLIEIRTQLIPHNRRDISVVDFSNEVRSFLQKNVPDAKIWIAMTDIMGNIDEAPIQLRITGNNMDSVLVSANRIFQAIKDIDGVMDSRLSNEGRNLEILVIPNTAKMASLGISLDVLGFSINNAIRGNTDAKFRENEKEYDINIQYDRFYRQTKEDIENLMVLNTHGDPIRLKQFAEIEELDGSGILERFNKRPCITFSSQVGKRPAGDVGNDILRSIGNLDLPDDTVTIPDGELELQDESFGSLGIAIIVSIMLIYFIMVILYDNYITPLIVLFSIPLAVIGALFALAMTMDTLNLFTILGMIVLIGLVTKNAILLVDFITTLRNNGMKTEEALVTATRQRFRPIFMTTIATIIGMLPIALSSGAGSEWKNGLAWVMIGGLTSSMFLTLIIIPLIYYIIENVGDRLFKRKIAK